MLRHRRQFPPVDPARGARIAQAYLSIPVLDTGMACADAYRAFVADTVRLYRAVRARFTVIHTATDPYPNSAELFRALRETGTLRVFLGGSPHPLLSVPLGGEFGTLTANDLFRAVHDMAHFDLGAGFGPAGEDAVYRYHRDCEYRPESVPALCTETRGQNSVFNFGPNPGNFADQKGAILPYWCQWSDRPEDDRAPSPEHVIAMDRHAERGAAEYRARYT